MSLDPKGTAYLFVGVLLFLNKRRTVNLLPIKRIGEIFFFASFVCVNAGFGPMRNRREPRDLRRSRWKLISDDQIGD